MREIWNIPDFRSGRYIMLGKSLLGILILSNVLHNYHPIHPCQFVIRIKWIGILSRFSPSRMYRSDQSPEIRAKTRMLNLNCSSFYGKHFDFKSISWSSYTTYNLKSNLIHSKIDDALKTFRHRLFTQMCIYISGIILHKIVTMNCKWICFILLCFQNVVLLILIYQLEVFCKHCIN